MGDPEERDGVDHEMSCFHVVTVLWFDYRWIQFSNP